MIAPLTAYRLLLTAGIAFAMPGCMTVEKALNRLPQVSAARVHIAQGTLYGSAQIDATNLRQSDTQATADSITVQITAPFAGTTTIHLEGYVRDKVPQNPGENVTQ
jgi:hypothetical protein